MLKAFYESYWFWPLVIAGFGYITIHTYWHRRQIRKQLEKQARGLTNPKRSA